VAHIHEYIGSNPILATINTSMKSFLFSGLTSAHH